MMADPLVEVGVRVYADFAEHATLAEVLTVIARCRTDLDTPSAAASRNLSNAWPGNGSPTGSERLAPDAREPSTNELHRLIAVVGCRFHTVWRWLACVRLAHQGDALSVILSFATNRPNTPGSSRARARTIAPCIPATASSARAAACARSRPDLTSALASADTQRPK